MFTSHTAKGPSSTAEAATSRHDFAPDSQGVPAYIPDSQVSSEHAGSEETHEEVPFSQKSFHSQQKHVQAQQAEAVSQDMFTSSPLDQPAAPGHKKKRRRSQPKSSAKQASVAVDKLHEPAMDTTSGAKASQEKGTIGATTNSRPDASMATEEDKQPMDSIFNFSLEDDDDDSMIFGDIHPTVGQSGPVGTGMAPSTNQPSKGHTEVVGHTPNTLSRATPTEPVKSTAKSKLSAFAFSASGERKRPAYCEPVCTGDVPSGNMLLAAAEAPEVTAAKVINSSQSGTPELFTAPVPTKPPRQRKRKTFDDDDDDDD